MNIGDKLFRYAAYSNTIQKTATIVSITKAKNYKLSTGEIINDKRKQRGTNSNYGCVFWHLLTNEKEKEVLDYKTRNKFRRITQNIDSIDLDKIIKCLCILES